MLTNGSVSKEDIFLVLGPDTLYLHFTFGIVHGALCSWWIFLHKVLLFIFNSLHYFIHFPVLSLPTRKWRFPDIRLGKWGNQQTTNPKPQTMHSHRVWSLNHRNPSDLSLTKMVLNCFKQTAKSETFCRGSESKIQCFAGQDLLAGLKLCSSFLCFYNLI